MALSLAVVLVSAAAVVAPAATAATPRPSLRIVDDTPPATLRGVGFQPGERVRVVIVAGTARSVKKAVATALGRFTVRVRADVNDCTGFSATAIGSKGTRASLKRAPGQCPQLQP